MRCGYFVDCFDPITNQHIAYGRQLMQKHQLSVLYFVAKETASCSLDDRNKMILRAIHPYRKLALAKNIPSDALIFSCEELQTYSLQVKQGHFQNLCYANKRFIITKGLYAEQMMEALLYPKRYLHSISVAKLSSQLAKAHHLDQRKAYLIGLFHDIAKKMDKQELASYLKINQPYEANLHPAVWHQYVGAYLLKKQYQLQDKIMLKAIRHHCLGDDSAPYSKIIFIADKCDPLRDYDSSKLIQLSLEDLDKGFETVCSSNKEYLRKSGAIQ